MAAPSKTPAAKQSSQPPEERFWIKYSPHHELPISSLASIAWHTFAVVLVIVIAFVVSINRTNDMPIESISLGGGGGNPQGIGPGSGTGKPSGLVEAATAAERPKDFRAPEKPLQDLDLRVAATDLFAGIADDPEALRQVAKMTERGTEALERLSKMDKNLRDQLLGQGKGGPGSGGGRGVGAGPGDGDGDGPGGRINARTKRKLRWTMMFNTSSGQDYLKQLHVLGAILALKPSLGEDVKVVKNLLARPVKLETEDLQKLDRIFWIDDKHESVEQLIRAMGLEFVPDRIIAFFPKELESQLLIKELGFRNKREDQILETRFQILMRGNGKYEIVVVDQRYY